CADCRAFAAEMGDALAVLKTAHEEVPASAHFAVVRARVLSELAKQRAPFWRRAWVYGLVAAAVALMLAVRLSVHPVHRPGPQPPPIANVAQPDAPASQKIYETVQSPHRKPVAIRPRRKTPLLVRQPRREPELQPARPLVVKLITEDPDVVIYWIADTTGE